MARVINVHAAVRGGTQWSTRRGRCFGPRLKTTLQLLSSPLFLSLGPDERCGKHAGAVAPPSGTFVSAQGFSCFQGTRAMRNISYVWKNGLLITFAVSVRADSICQQPSVGPKGGRRIGIYLRILPMRVFGRLNWELVDEREPGEEELG